MGDLSKCERKIAHELLKRGILRCHAEWQREMMSLLNSPLGKDENEYDRSMAITSKARKFYKEAMEMFYRNTWIITGLSGLYCDGYLTDADLSEVSEETQEYVKPKFRR